MTRTITLKLPRALTERILASVDDERDVILAIVKAIAVQFPASQHGRRP